MTSKLSKNIKKNILKPGFYIVATPIGNIKDITLRAIETLQNVDIIACEDTRVSKTLLDHYSIHTPTISIHNFNESDKISWVIQKINDGFSIALISDAGMPLISDPGFKIVNALRKANIFVSVLPGPSSSIAGLVISGLPTDRFLFIGFSPHKNDEKISFFKNVQSIDASIIFFETANRLLDTLHILNQIFPDREISVAREISKIYEEVKLDTPSKLLEHFSNHTLKGELVCVIAPPKKDISFDLSSIKPFIIQLLNYMSVKDVSDFFANLFDISKKNVYNFIINLKK